MLWTILNNVTKQTCPLLGDSFHENMYICYTLYTGLLNNEENTISQFFPHFDSYANSTHTRLVNTFAG